MESEVVDNELRSKEELWKGFGELLESSIALATFQCVRYQGILRW